ncbi:MAG: ABC transporter ATP-binding protein [Cyanobacteria bacterium P01_H01_bin.15]
MTIEVEKLSKVYDSTLAIQDVSFEVNAGEIVGFLGPNGAGKTTTLRILTGFLPASTGTARIAGFDVHENSLAVRQRIGYLPETPPLYPEMTVEGFLFFVARLKGVSAGDRKQRVDSALARCQLSDRKTSLIRKLSKGYRQRVGIAQAIVHDPPAIFLDEPTVGLDPRQIIEVRNLIKSLAGDHTIMLSTHILPEVSMTCDRVTIINGGRVVATDYPDRLLDQLAGNAGYDAEIAGEASTAQDCLRDIPGVEKVEVAAAENGRLTLTIATQKEAEPGSAISKALIQADIELYELRRTQATLEDVFLELTTQEAAVEDDTTLESGVEKSTGEDSAVPESPLQESTVEESSEEQET